MKISDRGIELIKRHEGFRYAAYLCPAGIWTIGYGHTSGVKQGDTCTDRQATQWLREDVEQAEKAVNKELPKLTQNQFDALVSFVFNVGAGNFRSSTLLKLAKKDPDNPDILLEFGKWIYGGGKALPGLAKRRQEEERLYFSA